MPKTLKYGLGAKLSPVDIRDYKFDKKCLAINYPDTFECRIKTEVKSQGMVGSCVAHSMAEILEYHFPETKMSTNFIYGIHHKLWGTWGPGMFCRAALRISQKYGDPEYEFCKGNTEVDEVYEIAEKAFNNKEAMANAKTHKISSYAHLYTNNDFKYALTRYGPIMASIMWYRENKLNPTGQLLQGHTADGYHAIVIRGWNETGWICQNSWGTSWGKGGYFILPYSYKVFEAFSVIPGEFKDDVIKPNRCEWLSKIINWLINLFRKEN